MSHSTPPTLLVWAVLSTLLGIFLVHHLYRYDRFKCLRWNHGAHSGAFKRIMTYTYLVTIPLIMTYSIGFAAIKYEMGYTYVPEYGIQPMPWQEWPKTYQHAIFPLYLVFSVGWSLELVTHLEELCFWLFLVNAGRAGQDWFRSGYFKVWVGGSAAALLYMPLVTIFTRADPLKNEAYTFLAGSLGSLCITLWFTPILWTFPKFVERLRSEGVDMNTLLRLVKFHELNTIRIALRLVFCVSLIILGVDGARPHQHINDKCFWTELLSMLAGVGVTVSSAITLVIFFPRNIETEYSVKQASHHSRSLQLRSRAGARSSAYAPPPSPDRKSLDHNIPDSKLVLGAHGVSELSLSPDSAKSPFESPRGSTKSPFDLEGALELEYAHAPPEGTPVGFALEHTPVSFAHESTPVSFAPNRRLDTGATVRGAVTLRAPHALALRTDAAPAHPYARRYTSPIDLEEEWAGPTSPGGRV